MKRTLFFAAITTLVLSSCSTAYQAGQTPDDLYYSPGRPQEASTVKEQRRSQEDEDQYQEYVSSSDDRYLRMKTANREKWSTIDNYGYWNDSRYDFNTYNYNSFYNNFSFYNPYYYSTLNPYYMGAGWMLGLNYFGAGPFGYGTSYGGYGYGSYYSGLGWGNPLYTVIGYGTPKALGSGSTTPISSINAYKNHYINNTNGNYSSYTGTQNSFSNLVKRVFTGGSNGTSSSFERPARSFSTTPSSPTYTPSNSSSGTSSSAGGNSGGFKSAGSSSSTGRGGKG